MANAKCQKYLNMGKRVTNKTRKLEKRFKTIKKEGSLTHIRRDCKIGRAQEGAKQEDFKHKPSKNKPVIEVVKKR